MGECNETGQLGWELFDMTRQRRGHYEEHFVGPGPGNVTSPESEPKGLSLSLWRHLAPVGGGGSGGSGL
jgi:hypothetical protein